VTCEYRPVPTESSDAQQPQGHSSTSTPTVGVDAECGPRANYAISTSGPEGCASSLAPVSLQLSQYGVARSPFNVNAPEFCPDTPYFTSDTDRALLPDEDSEQTYLKQQQYYWEYSPSDHTRHEPIQTEQFVNSDMVPPQDRPPDILVCPQDRPPDDPVRPQDRPPDRSTNSDRQTDSDETHLKFADDEILMLRTKPNNELPEHVNVLFLKTLEDVDLNPETQEGLKQLLSDHRDTFATSSLDLGFCPLVQHDTDTGDATTVAQNTAHVSTRGRGRDPRRDAVVRRY